MADPEHLEILMQGVKVWNEWKIRHGKVRPHYIGTEFLTADLSEAHLSNLDLSDIDFNRMNLCGVNFSGTKLCGASFTESYLQGVNFHGADLGDTNFDIGYISMDSGGMIDTSKLRNQSNTSFENAKLTWSSFANAFLEGVSFKGADLLRTNFDSARLGSADFTGARFKATVLSGNDLSSVKGLDSVLHEGPSSISIDTLFLSRGRIPEIFLRGCGVPDHFITYMRSLTVQPIQFYSCFISYSSKDQEFTERLHADLQAKGVRVWFAPHDLPIGARIRHSIDESIRVHDKLLLVLSEHSISSQWVEQEVETALSREREQGGKTILFPVRLDDAVMRSSAGWPALLKNTRNVGDFTDWKDHDSYRKAFDRLLRDLRAEEKKV